VNRQLPIGNGQNANGYTLIELLVVVAIISIIGLGVPMLMVGGGSGFEARTTAIRLANELRATRGDAIRLGTSAQLAIASGGATYKSSSAQQAIHVPRGVALAIDPKAGSPGSQDSTVTFFPDGSADASYIRLTAQGQAYNIVVRPLSGRVSIEEGK
jgi:prepilin-type N-terminal cleavage/methylation domain-containing protein